MKRCLVWLLIATGCTYVAGCTTPERRRDERGSVRFSQVLPFAETSDFSAPFAMGLPVMVALEKAPDEQVSDESRSPRGSVSTAHVSLMLHVADTYGEPAGTVVPLGRAQRITTHVVPVDQNDQPLLGFLPITAHATETVTLDTPLAGRATMANALEIEAPVRSPPGTAEELLTEHMAEIHIDNAYTGESILWQLPIQPADAPVACPENDDSANDVDDTNNHD